MSSYAEALAEAGAAVVIADLDLGAATATADALAAKGHTVTGTSVDVRSAESAEAMVASAVDAHGGVDILINNAAIMVDLPPYGLANMPVEDWDRVLEVNLRGRLLCTQAAVPVMESRGGGRVVNGLSAGAFMPGGIYGVSKFALHGFEHRPSAPAAAIAAPTASSSLLSPATTATRSPTWAASSAARTASGSRTATPTPSATSRRTVAPPRPPAPPATIADWPSSRIRLTRRS